MFSSQSPFTKQPKMYGFYMKQKSKQENCTQNHCSYQLDSQWIEKLLYFSFNSIHHPSEWLPQSLYAQSSASPLSSLHFVFLLLDTNRIHEEGPAACFSKPVEGQSVLGPLPLSAQLYYRINCLKINKWINK